MPGWGFMTFVSVWTQHQSTRAWILTRVLMLNICRQLHTHGYWEEIFQGGDNYIMLPFALLPALSAEPFIVTQHSANTHVWLFLSSKWDGINGFLDVQISDPKMASLKSQHFLRVIVFNGTSCKDRLLKLSQRRPSAPVSSVCVISTGSAELAVNEAFAWWPTDDLELLSHLLKVVKV